MIFHTFSPKKTQEIAALLGQEILRSKLNFPRLSASNQRKPALVLALSGELGTGKTTFVQGFMKGAGIKNRIISPTFVIAKRYTLNAKYYKHIYHIDCYRIHKPNELLNIGIKEILSNPQNIVLVEWSERIRRLLPKNVVIIELKHNKKENERIVLIKQS